MVMFKMAEGRILLVCAFVFVYIGDISSADVTSTVCTSGGTECDAIHNASCNTSLSSLKCKCDQGYKETTTTCTAIGLGETCSVVADCKTVAHSECKSTTCACLHGYTQISSACVKGLANSACLQRKCACAPGYVKSGNICSPIYGKSCTNDVGCAGLNNSTCTNGKCACVPGYEASNDICSPVSESGAVSMKSAVGLVFGSMILLLIQAL